MARFVGFWQLYRSRKGSGSPSALAPLIALLQAFPEPPTRAAITTVRAEQNRLRAVKRFFSESPAMKYGLALDALTDELNALDSELRIGNTDAAAARNFNAGRERRTDQYKRLLAASKTDKEYCDPISAAMVSVCAEPKFAKYLFEEVGWTNATSWVSWAIRAVTPAMAAGWAAKDATAIMRKMALSASVSGHIYLERYFLDLSIYCAAAADKADVGVIFEQASMIFGPLIGPAMAAVGGGTVAQNALKGGKKLADVGISAGMNAAATDDFQTTDVAISYEGKDVKKAGVNFMRFTHAWLKYALHETPTPAMSIVLAEFGGRRGCERLLETLLAL